MSLAQAEVPGNRGRLRPHRNAARGVHVRRPLPVLGGRGSRTAASASRCCRTTSPRGRSGASTSRAGRSRNIVHIPGNVLTPGSWRVAQFIDDGATDEQFQALQDAYSGRLGGPLADLAGLVGEVLTVERVPISHQVVDGVGTLDVGDFAHCEMEPFRGADGTITTLRDSIFSTVPGSPAYAVQGHGAADQPAAVRARVVGGPERHPGRLPHDARESRSDRSRRARGRLGATVPVAVAAAWAVALARPDRRRSAGCCTRTTRRATARRPLWVVVLLPPFWLTAVVFLRRVAGDGRGDDAAVEPADGAAVLARGPPPGAARTGSLLAFLGGYAAVWARVRRGGVRGRCRRPPRRRTRAVARRRTRGSSPAAALVGRGRCSSSAASRTDASTSAGTRGRSSCATTAAAPAAGSTSAAGMGSSASAAAGR